MEQRPPKGPPRAPEGAEAPAAPTTPSNRQPRKSREQRLSEVFMKLPLPIAERKFRAGQRKQSGRGRRPGGGGGR
jgi:hypothetical protein